VLFEYPTDFPTTRRRRINQVSDPENYALVESRSLKEGLYARTSRKSRVHCPQTTLVTNDCRRHPYLRPLELHVTELAAHNHQREWYARLFTDELYEHVTLEIGNRHDTKTPSCWKDEVSAYVSFQQCLLFGPHGEQYVSVVSVQTTSCHKTRHQRLFDASEVEEIRRTRSVPEMLHVERGVVGRLRAVSPHQRRNLSGCRLSPAGPALVSPRALRG
jgi:hypothetical protein